MLINLYYVYAIITSCVVAGVIMNMYNSYYLNRIALESVLCIKGVHTFEEAKKAAAELRNNTLGVPEASRTAKNTAIALIFSIGLIVLCLLWWTQPITRLKITKDVLTSNWVEL